MGTTRRQLLVAAALTGSVVIPAAAGSAELDVVWMGWPEEQVNPLMDNFRETHPDITLNVERIPFNQLFETLEVRLAARNADPDIFITDGPLTGSYAVRGHLLDLSDQIDQDRFTKAAIDQGSFDGKLYSAPFGSSSQLLFYNKQLFEAAGIEPPSADPAERWTWEKTVEVAKQLRDPANEVWGLVIEQSERPYQLLPLAQSKGGQAIGDDKLTAAGYIDSEPFVEAFTFYQKLFNEWDVSPKGVFDGALARELFGTGKAAMFLGVTYDLKNLESYPDIDWGVATHPYFEGGEAVTPTGAWHIGVNPRTDDMESAMTFVEWAMSDDLQRQWFGLRPYVPVLRAVYDLEAEALEHPGWQIARYELDNTAIPRPATPGFREYEDILRQAFRDIQTGAPVQETLSAAAQKIDRELAKYR
jgi:fructooligosaccharide transport system substrate-binding protein